ncbi:MAG: carboxypeptidase-like regulatory domain-containing protein [Fibromonadaceae bacterium]|nr:carboxypeptidase-like regulatory domain-containing protein [Fibromonadaceae bacterium]
MDTIKIAILLVCAISSAYLHATPMRGVVLEDATDRPIPYANISYASGKAIGQSDGKGRFEFDLDSRNAILVFYKNGFDSLKVEMQDYADLLDVVVGMKSDARYLGSATVVGGTGSVWQNPKTVSVQKLEDAAGLRFDLTEHLSQLPGMSGQMDFSGNLFYDGSRSEEIAYHLGELRVPNMRHLDIGFPGNLSVINPRAIENININEHYGTAPFNQGTAGSVQFMPRDSDDFKTDVSLGTALREIYIEGPWLFWDGFAFSARYLDPSMLKNMGEKFFTEFKRQSDSNDDNHSNSFKLSSMDIYARFFGKDSSQNIWATTALYASDYYTVSQDTGKMSTPVIEGSQVYKLASAEYKSLSGIIAHTGVVQQETANTMRDTSAFRRTDNETNETNGTYLNLIDDYSKTHLTANLGFSWEQTANLGFALLYDFHNVNRKWIDFGWQNSELNDNVFQASGYYTLGSNVLSAGGVFSLSEKQVLPLASFDIEKGKGRDFSIFGNAAWRSDWDNILEGSEIKGKLNGGASLKAGARTSLGGMKISAHGFGRYYPNPLLPIPKAYEHYKEQQSANYAWVRGSQITLDYHSIHSIAFQSNLAHVSGQYELPNGSLPWQANSRIDMVSHIRIYPKSDSLFSLIFSHRAALDRPLYEWAITPSRIENGEQITGERRIKQSSEYASLFRTDARINLDLKSKVKIFMLDNIRFFAEANNIFSPINAKPLRFLGDENARERSVAVRSYSKDYKDGYDIVPFMAKGMGLYFQFGVEGSFK